MKTKLIILGSGNSLGVPRIDGNWGKCESKNKKNFRTRCSAIILRGSNSILIDTSPDIRKQFVDNKIKNISSVIYTHEHADQTNGIFELRPFYWKNKKKIDIYGNKKTINLLKKRFDYCFKKTRFYPPIIKANIINGKFALGTVIPKHALEFLDEVLLKHIVERNIGVKTALLDWNGLGKNKQKIIELLSKTELQVIKV